MKCFRCRKEEAVASVTPLGGLVLCVECSEKLLDFAAMKPPPYFGRCYRDVLRLCTPSCTHCEVSRNMKSMGGEVNSAHCLAHTMKERSLRDGEIIVNDYPIHLRQREDDDYLRDLLLTTRPEFIAGLMEKKVEQEVGKEEDRDDDDSHDDGGGYREGDWNE